MNRLHTGRRGGSLGVIGRIKASVPNWFAERQIFYRRRGQVSFISISRPVQVVLTVVVLGFVGWVGYSSLFFARYDQVLSQKNRQIAKSRIAYRTAMREVASYNNRLLTITRNLERSQAQLLTLFNPNPGPRALGAKPRNRFTDFRRALNAVTHSVMTNRVRDMEREWRELTVRNATLERGLDSIGNEVENILTEHGIVKAERNRLRDRVKRLEGQLVSLKLRQNNLVTRLARRTDRTVAESARVIAMTGLDLDRLIATAARERGKTFARGGPYVKVAKADDALSLKVAVLDSQLERWRYIRIVLRRLPLVTPLEHYRMSSNFGMRRDPITRRWSMHNGMDFAYHVNTPVLATAPGTVVFAGWRGGFGWFIEIDHGLGIRTRYAHLRQILVKKGDRIEYRRKIGLLGNSGRSRGPHVHYEVLVNGKSVDPRKFIKAGKYVFKG